MTRYVARRLLFAIPTFFGITLLTFAVMHLAPGDPVLLQGGDGLSDGISREAVEQQRRALGLNDPLHVRYGRWVAKIVQLDFGISTRDHRPVITKIGEALPRTAFLSFLALTLSFALAVPLGLVAAAKRNAAADRAISAGLFVLYSLPSFWAAIMLLLFFASPRGIPLFPLQGLVSEDHASLGPLGKLGDLLWHAVLPVACLTYGSLASLSRHLRAGVIEALGQDFVRTARAKGLAERTVILRHAFRNSLIPMVSLLGLMLPHVLSGSVIVEQVFGIPGMGSLALEAILYRDHTTVMGVTTFVALFTLVALLLSDLLYAAVDPRIREVTR